MVSVLKAERSKVDSITRGLPGYDSDTGALKRFLHRYFPSTIKVCVLDALYRSTAQYTCELKGIRAASRQHRHYA